MFGFTEEEEMFCREVRRFAQRELAPFAKQRAKTENPYPIELRRKMAKLGLFGITLPVEYGGQGPGGYVKLGIAFEEIGAADINAPNPSSSLVAGQYIVLYGDKEMSREWLPGLIKGEKVGCLAVTEPECGSDAAAIRTRAKKEGQYYVLSGEKTSITGGADADIAVVFAKTDPAAGPMEVTAFLVPLDSASIKRTVFSDTGWMPMRRASIFFDDVRIPEKYRLGEEGRGFLYLMKHFDYLRVTLCIWVLGAARTSIEEAISYAKQRNAFGRPISTFEGVAFKIAEHATRLEACRLLCYRALWLKDQNLQHTKEAAMYKWLGPRVAVEAIHDALLIHGHYGYSTDCALEQRLRDAIGFEIADGTAEIQKLVIARQILGKGYAP
ncbi:MAG: hypothetical protein FJ005_08385 [Chloroflexi bacterium]|nr:hypothetical protein [Chloroflexota bacterium]